jgi:hypothetical protein
MLQAEATMMAEGAAVDADAVAVAAFAVVTAVTAVTAIAGHDSKSNSSPRQH